MEDGGLCDLVKLGTNLQWPGDLQMATQKDGQTAAQTAKDDRASVRSDVVSVKESEKELLVNSEKKRGGGADDKTMLASQKKEEFVENQLPEKAAQVFLPAVTVLRASASSPRENQEIWEMESQKSPLLVPPGKPHNYNHHQCPFDSDEATAQSGCTCAILVCLWRAGQRMEVGGVLMFVCPPVSGGHGCPSREVLKVGVSLMSAAMFFPFLAWGGYVFLPFDAPLLDDTPLRLVYTLRCSVFAITPIVLGEYRPTLTSSSSSVCDPCDLSRLFLRLAGFGGLSAQVRRDPPAL